MATTGTNNQKTQQLLEAYNALCGKFPQEQVDEVVHALWSISQGMEQELKITARSGTGLSVSFPTGVGSGTGSGYSTKANPNI